MNKDNFDYLKNQVKDTGFGEGLEGPLKEKIEGGHPDFTLKHDADYGGDNVSATLHFRRSDERDMYFFNKYDLTLKRGNDDTEAKQTFFIGKDNNITFEEGYNLLDGRSVNKDMVSKKGEKYNSWLKLNFNDANERGNFKMKHFHENYGYDVEAALMKHPIKELEDPTAKERLIGSLKKGNKQSVTYLLDGETHKGYAQANPRFKSIKLFNEQGTEIRKIEKKSEKQETSPAEKNKAKQDEEDSPNKSGQGRLKYPESISAHG